MQIKTFCLLSLLLIMLNPLTARAQKSREAEIDSIMQAHKDFSGVMLVANNGAPVYHKAFGYADYAQKTPLQTSDIFELASVSKQFTAMIIMMLEEKGNLKL